jgi:DNA-binding MarR family transcriptional regulator
MMVAMSTVSGSRARQGAHVAAEPAAARATEPRWLSAEEEAAWRGLQLMQMQLEARLHRQLATESGLSLSDYVVLVALTDQPDGRMRAFELGGVLGWEKSRLSHHVSRMAARALVCRERCETDRRGAIVAVTDHGRAVIGEAAPGHVAAVRRLFLDHVTPEQLAALREITDTVNAHLCTNAASELDGPVTGAASHPSGAGEDHQFADE